MAAPSHLLLHILRPPPSSSLLFHFIKPLCITTTTAGLYQQTPLRTTTPFFTSLSCHSLSPSLTFPQPPPPHSLSHDAVSPSDSEDEDEDEDEIEIRNDKETVAQTVKDSTVLTRNRESALKLPSLSVKEKKELAAYAHSLGKKLRSQQVGKSGVTASVASALIETLESNELLKLKIHRTCPGELADVVNQLEEATGSVVVGQIGRAVILYRPSLTKLKAEEKKKQAQARRGFVRKELTFKPTLQKKGRVPSLFGHGHLSGHGRRGSGRV